MAITVEGPDGAIHEFPEGTSREAIKRTLDRIYGQGKDTQAARASAVSYALGKTGADKKRSGWERFADNLLNTGNTSPSMEFYRSRFTNPLLGIKPIFQPFEQAQRTMDDLARMRDVIQGKPVKLPKQDMSFKGLLRTSVDSVLSHPGTGLPQAGLGFAAAGVATEALMPGTRQQMITQERTRRTEFAAKSAADPFHKADGGILGKGGHGAAALAGVVAGTAMDPISYVTAGQGAFARVLVQMGLAGGTDLMGQSFAMDGGFQDDIDLKQTTLSALAGGAFTGLGELVAGFRARRGKLDAPAEPIPHDAPLDAHFKAELDAADIIGKPAMSLRELPDLRAANDNLDVLPDVPRAPADPAPESPKDFAGEKGFGSERAAGGEGRAEGGPDQDPWKAVDWGGDGATTRKLAAAAHLETLRRTIKPEHAEAFGRWIGQGAPRMLGEGSEGRVNANWFDWDRLSSNPDDFLDLQASLQAFFGDTYAKAGKAHASWDAVGAAAKTFGARLSNIVAAHGQIVGANGEAGLAAKLLALESIADGHADNLIRHINAMKARVADGRVLPEDIAKLAAGVQETTLMDAMATGAGSEVARALNILKMARQRRRAVNDMEAALDFLREATGSGETLDAAKLGPILERLSGAYRKKGVGGLKNEIRKAREFGLMDYAGYLITGGLLSAPKSFVRNVLGSVSFVALNTVERYVAAGFGSMRAAVNGSTDRVTFREANAYAAGLAGSFSEAFRAGLDAFRWGGAMDGSSVLPDGKMSSFVPFKMSPDRWSKWRMDPLRNLPEMMAWGVFSATRTLGFRPSIAMDEFTKVLGRNAQLNALAIREATYRAAREAKPGDQNRVFAEVLEAVRQDPTAEAVKLAREFFEDTGQDARSVHGPGSKAEEMSRILASLDIRKMAEDHARELAFQKIGPRVQKVDEALRAFPVIKYFYAPFLRTPLALLKAGVMDRTPLAFAGNYKALIGAQEGLHGAIERGGAEADLAWAKLMVGTGLMATALALYQKGDLVGGRGDSRSSERADSVRPYSIRIGDEWIDFSPLSPVAEPFGLVADLAQILGDRQPDQETGEALVGAVMTAISNNILNKTSLQGLHQFDQTVFGGTQSGSEEAKARNAGEKLAATAMSAVPLSSLLRSVAQDIDPVRRDAHGLLDQFMALTPGLSQRLPAMRDVFGRPLVRSEGERGAFQAVNHVKRSNDPMALELARLGKVADLSLARPDRRFNGERLEPAEYGRMLEVQGQLWRHPATGMNMQEAVADMMKTHEYAEWGDEQRAYEVKQLISKYRTFANRAMKNPRSEFYMGEVVKRTASAALRKEIRSKGLSDGRAFSRGRHMGLSPEDANAEIEALRQAIHLEDEPQE